MPAAHDPKLGDPMAEALAEDAANAARAAQQPAAQPQAAAPTQEPAPQTPAEPAPVAAAPEPQASSEPAQEPSAEPAKAKKTPQELLLARVGKLTASQKASQDENARLTRELEAARALLASQQATGGEPAASPASSPALPAGAAVYTQEQLEARAEQIATSKAFNARANETYLAGREKFGDWDSTMGILRDMGLMTQSLLEATFETDNPLDVLHALGTDLEAAERIAALSPIRMGVELAKMSASLNVRAPVKISQAPAPVNPVNGHATPELDLARLAESDDMTAWAAARKAQGDRWANPRRR